MNYNGEAIILDFVQCPIFFHIGSFHKKLKQLGNIFSGRETNLGSLGILFQQLKRYFLKKGKKKKRKILYFML